MARMRVVKPTWISFGGTAGIVTSMGLILGLHAAATSRQAIIGTLLIVAVADNISDSLSVHVYQESERLDADRAWFSTLANFAARLLVSATFVVLVIALPRAVLPWAAAGWGTLLLAALTFGIARARSAPPGREIAKHLAIAAVVLAISRVLGLWIGAAFG